MDRPDDEGMERTGMSEGMPSILRRLRASALAIGLCAGLGAVIAIGAAEYSAGQFRAETHLAIHRASPQVVEAAIGELTSKPVVDNVIRALNLDRGEEFSSNRPTVVRVVSEIVSGQVTTVTEAEDALRRRVREAVSASYDAKGQTVAIAVVSRDPQEAAAIADRLAGEFERALVARAGSPSSPQLDAMRQAAERAGSALDGFTAKIDEATLVRLQDMQARRTALDTEIAATDRHLRELQDRHRSTASMTVDHVLSAPLPDSLEFTGLEYQRRRYVQAELDLEQISASLGPKHPRRAAVQAAFDDAGRDIAAALRQLSGSLQQQVTSAEKALAGLKEARTAASADKSLSDTAAQLSTLQAAADEARRNVDKAESDPARRKAATIPSLRLVSPASADTAERLGPNLPMFAGIGAACGGLLGLVLAMARYRRQSRLAEAWDEEAIYLDIPEPAAAALPEEKVARPVALPSADSMPDVDQCDDEDERFAANDTAFGDRMKALLQENRRPASEAELPPLVDALVDESRNRMRDEPSSQWGTIAGRAPEYDEEELLALQRELAELRRLVALHEEREFRAAG
jgi:polysaccharide biosynthesis transport protein